MKSIKYKVLYLKNYNKILISESILFKIKLSKLFWLLHLRIKNFTVIHYVLHTLIKKLIK